jgi:outer membrane protein TolC
MHSARLVLKGYMLALSLGLALLSLAAGCAGTGGPLPDTVVERLLEPAGASTQPDREVLPPLQKPLLPESPSLRRQPDAVLTCAGVPARPLTLPEAVALAFELQPRLRAALESIEQAARRQDIVHAAFLPVASTGYHVGGFDLNVGGAGVPLPTSVSALAQRFTFIPFTGSVPLGLDVKTGYEVAELKVQWLLCDFGRRLGRYNQAGLAVDIARLQADRARQTVASEVAVAYYQVLRDQALARTARDAVRRAEEELGVARKLAKGGALEREKVLRAEVELAKTRRALDLAEEAESVAVAALNLAIGLNVSAPTQVAEAPPDTPPFDKGLAECLQTAVSQRRELGVAQRAIESAQVGTRVARADFAPKLIAEGSLLDFQQASPRGHADFALGLIKMEWTLFEGGKRLAEKRLADSKVRDALAQAETIADTIAFQVNRAYRHVLTARTGIERARPAVEQAREYYRLVHARYRTGDATPSDIVEAEASLTRAEQDYLNSLYDYRTALIRLEYAVGVTPTH